MARTWELAPPDGVEQADRGLGYGAFGEKSAFLHW